jgi:hypothetical protein
LSTDRPSRSVRLKERLTILAPRAPRDMVGRPFFAQNAGYGRHARRAAGTSA